MKPTTAVCPCGDVRCEGSYLHGWDPRDGARQDSVALRTIEGGLYMAAITVFLVLLLGTLASGCAPRAGCVDRVVLVTGAEYGWTEALDDACPPTESLIEWSEYDHENNAVVASCVCYSTASAGVGAGVGR